MSVEYNVIKTATGEVVGNGTTDDISLIVLEADESIVEAPRGAIGGHIDAEGAYTPRPTRPSESHVFNYSTMEWALDVGLKGGDLKAQVTVLFNTKQNANFVYATFTFQGDAESRERINEVLNYIHDGAALPPDWNGWRDVDNVNRWSGESYSVLITHLTAMRNILVERRQALFTAATDHKDAIDALVLASNVSGLEAYDVSTGWP